MPQRGEGATALWTGQRAEDRLGLRDDAGDDLLTGLHAGDSSRALPRRHAVALGVEARRGASTDVPDAVLRGARRLHRERQQLGRTGLPLVGITRTNGTHRLAAVAAGDDRARLVDLDDLVLEG